MVDAHVLSLRSIMDPMAAYACDVRQQKVRILRTLCDMLSRWSQYNDNFLFIS